MSRRFSVTHLLIAVAGLAVLIASLRFWTLQREMDALQQRVEELQRLCAVYENQDLTHLARLAGPMTQVVWRSSFRANGQEFWLFIYCPVIDQSWGPHPQTLILTGRNLQPLVSKEVEGGGSFVRATVEQDGFPVLAVTCRTRPMTSLITNRYELSFDTIKELEGVEWTEDRSFLEWLK